MIHVRTQTELDQALATHPDEVIVLEGDGTFTFTGSSSPRVEAWGSSSPRVEARGSSSPRVEARESSSPHGTVGRWAHLVGQVRDSATFDIPGVVLLETPTIDTAELWCEYHGVTVTDGVAVLFKAVDDQFRSGHGFAYVPGTAPEAPDWDGGKAECGGGLHFAASPGAALSFFAGATRFVACPVAEADIVVHLPAQYPEKVKAPRVAAQCWEVDLAGEPIPVAEAAA